jgi:hypothetical protein
MTLNATCYSRRTLWAALACIAFGSGSSLHAREVFSMYMISGYPTGYVVPAGHRLVIEGVHLASGGQVLMSLSACNNGAPANLPGSSAIKQCAAYNFVAPPVTNAALGNSLTVPVRIYVETSFQCYVSTGSPGTTKVPAGTAVTITGYLEPLSDVVF